MKAVEMLCHEKQQLFKNSWAELVNDVAGDI